MDVVTELHATLERLRRRHAGLSRMMRQNEAEAEDLTRRGRGKVTIAGARDRADYHRVWSRWSQSHDDVAAAADRLLRSRPGRWSIC